MEVGHGEISCYRKAGRDSSLENLDEPGSWCQVEDRWREHTFSAKGTPQGDFETHSHRSFEGLERWPDEQSVEVGSGKRPLTARRDVIEESGHGFPR